MPESNLAKHARSRFVLYEFLVVVPYIEYLHWPKDHPQLNGFFFHFLQECLEEAGLFEREKPSPVLADDEQTLGRRLANLLSEISGGSSWQPNDEVTKSPLFPKLVDAAEALLEQMQVNGLPPMSRRAATSPASPP